MGNENSTAWQSGDKIEGFYLIKSMYVKTASNNSRYIDFTLSDKSMEFNSKYWNCTADDEKLYLSGVIVKIRGTVTLYNNSVQVKIDKIRTVTEGDNISLSELIPSAPYKAEDMMREIIEYIGKIKNNDIKNIIKNILMKLGDKMMLCPAAVQNHHSIRSGLLYHIKRMLEAAEKLGQVYSFLNMDLLYAGVILHDMAKTLELQVDSSGLASDLTVEGKLLGHIIQGIKIIDRAAAEEGADTEASIILQHMILSHHYEPEYGSPKRPMLPEAELLHYLDMIDARMYDMEKALLGTDEGHFTDKVWVLHNRQLYKTNIVNNRDIVEYKIDDNVLNEDEVFMKTTL